MAKIKTKEIPYSQIVNTLLEDNRLSFKAKGIYAYMHSKPTDWNFTMKSIATQQKDGYDSIKAGIQELRELGFIIYEKLPNGKGIYHLTDEASTIVKPKTDNPTKAKVSQTRENPLRENPIKGKSTPISNKDSVSNKDLNSNKDINVKITYPKNLNVEAFEAWKQYKGKNITAADYKQLPFMAEVSISATLLEKEAPTTNVSVFGNEGEFTSIPYEIEKTRFN